MSETSKPTPDYLSMEGGDLLNFMGDNAYRWAEAFCQIKAAKGWTAEEINEDLMVGWFANAILRGQDEQRWRIERAARGLSVVVPPPLTDA